MKQSRIARVCRSMVRIYTESRIATAAAGFSYFLTLAFFPMLICLYTMLGSLFPAADEIAEFLSGLLPVETVDVILDYLGYVSGNLSGLMLFAALTVVAVSSSGALRLVAGQMERIRGFTRFNGFFRLLFSFIFSLVFLAVIYIGVVLMVTGRWFLDFVDAHIPFVDIRESWRWWRFAVLFLLLFLIISEVYRITAPKEPGIRMLPGAALASLSLVAVSILFSYFIGFSARYPLVYGSLASIILMMLWFYICGTILFLGNALNVSLERVE